MFATGRKLKLKKMPEPVEDAIVRNLIDALHRLHDDLDRVELWTAALSQFQHPAPEYEPGKEYDLPTSQTTRHQH